MAVIVFRGLLGDDEDRSFVANEFSFRGIGEQSKIFKFRLGPEQSFETAILGHSALELNQGPLTVAALGWNPPERSIQFHLSLLSLQGDQVLSQVKPPTKDESKVIEEQLIRLNTKSLTVLIGEGLDHALVCEKRIDLRTYTPSEVLQDGKNSSLPEGDSENEFRRFIDDSINLLSELEFNIRRMDEGITPINLCWPWGHGQSPRIPNRALELGYPWRVFSESFAMRGLSRLSGFRSQKLFSAGSLDWASLSRDIQSDPRTLVVIDIPVPPSDDEEREVFQDQITNMGQKLVDPLLEWRRESKGQLIFLATNRANMGLIGFSAKENERDHFPFDERSLTEKKVPEIGLTNLLESHG